MSGTTYGRNSGVTTSSPSTALSTEIAGVIIPSPYSSAVPKMPRAMRIGRPTASLAETPRSPLSPGTSAVSARMPPSPWLSARMTIATYLIEMTSTSA